MVGGMIVGKTLVTGATGFTGGRLCHRLVQDGQKVVAFVRSIQKAGSLQQIGVECREVDITDPKDVVKNFNDIEKVFHIAAARPWGFSFCRPRK